jgi:hypothetical protein
MIKISYYFIIKPLKGIWYYFSKEYIYNEIIKFYSFSLQFQPLLYDKIGKNLIFFKKI